jgi:hypothetical protein
MITRSFSLVQHTPAACSRVVLDNRRHFLCFTFVVAFLSFVLAVLGSSCGTTPITRSLNLQKLDPWRGLVQKSPVMSSVGHHATGNSFLDIRSVIKKYLVLICFVLFELEARPFFSRRIIAWLSWYTRLSLTVWACSSKNCRTQTRSTDCRHHIIDSYNF